MIDYGIMWNCYAQRFNPLQKNFANLWSRSEKLMEKTIQVKHVVITLWVAKKTYRNILLAVKDYCAIQQKKALLIIDKWVKSPYRQGWSWKKFHFSEHNLSEAKKE